MFDNEDEHEWVRRDRRGGGIIAGTAPAHNEVVFDADRLHPYAPGQCTHD
jgi:hypothetical protein